MKLMLLVALTVCAVSYIILWSSLAKPVSETDSPASGITKKGRKFVLYAGTGAVTNFFDTLGIGSFATTTCMILVSLLGMSPRAAFPIMMGSCAFMMPVGGIRFIRGGAYHLRAAVGLALGGIPGVLAAAFLVRSLSLSALHWMVIIVVVYAAIVMLRSAKVGQDHLPNT